PFASKMTMPARRPSAKKGTGTGRRRWSARVTASSNALDLEPGVFNGRSAIGVARSLKRSADQSRRRKADPFRSAMSMLTFFINRAGRQLSPRQRRILEQAKDELRALYGRPHAG